MSNGPWQGPPEWQRPPGWQPLHGRGPSAPSGPPAPHPRPGPQGPPPGGGPSRVLLAVALVVVVLATAATAWLLWLRDEEPAPGDTPKPEAPSPTAATEPAPPPAVPTAAPTAADPVASPIVVAGSSLMSLPMEQLSSLTDVPFTLAAIGQGAGAMDFADGHADVVMVMPGLRDDQLERGGGACVVPANTHQFLVTAQMTHLLYNLDGVDDLALDAATTAAIYSGEITNWDDPAIAALNPDAELPDLAITALHRADAAPVNQTVQRWLVAATDGAWPEPRASWGVDFGQPVEQSGGMLETLRFTPGAIGYLDAPQSGELPAASLVVDGELVPPAPENLEGHLDAAIIDPATPPDPLRPGAYPLVDFGYLVTCMEYDDPGVGLSVRDFVATAMTAEAQDVIGGFTGVTITPTDELVELAETIR